MSRSWTGCALAICAMFALAAPAQADINAFNAAVAKGDYKAAAAEAEVIWDAWNKADKETALVAREFGYAAYMAGRYDLARRFGQFLVEEGAALPAPDKEPAISKVLLRTAEFSLSAGDTEAAALREALLARSQETGVDMTSVVGWERLYRARWAKGAWGEAERDAALAAEFFERTPSLLVRQRNAEVVRGAAAFAAERKNDTTERNRAYFIMADTHDALSGDINRIEDQAVLKQLWPLKWTSEAWAYAMESYLGSSDRQVGSFISSELKPRRLVQPDYAQYPESEATRSLPVCDGEFQGRKVTYPSSKAFQGQVGSVIARMETDASGKVTDVEVLASVPGQVFAEGVVSVLKTWTYKPSKKSAGASCRLNYRNHLYKVRFYIS
ncbi:MAG TPA: TonB family protein [Hyphomonadaceae bacterium]|nr:TonB family protein [Hyphomonadaceae bacterium]